MSDSLKDKASARYQEARDKVGDAVAKGRARAEGAYARGKANAEHAAAAGRAKARDAAQSARTNAKKAARKTSQSVEQNPLVALVGGLAIGAIAAALLPRTAREDKLAGNVGRTVRKTAKTAAKVARERAKSELDGLGVNADAARAQFKDIAAKVGKAAASAGAAAVDSARKK
jgi:ElaB/YqjD/DUF883 family membrane-anchored ribosome-binding protein